MSSYPVTVAIWGILPLTLLFCGIILLWIASWRQMRRSMANPFARSSISLTFLGWSLLSVGVLGVAISTAWWFSIITIPMVLVVTFSGLVRHRLSELRFLIWSLAEAAERGIPLEKSARAFASEQGGWLASSARRLAEYLDAAMPLSVALARSGFTVSSAVRLAADVGEKNGTLGPSLRQAVEQTNAFDRTLGSILAKFFYLGCLLFVMVNVVTFMMIKIVPTFEQMFEEFGIQLPAATIMLISVSRFMVNFWFLLLPLALLLIFAIVLGLLAYVGFSLQSLPLVRLFFTPLDSATVLHSLSIAVQSGQSISDNLLQLASLARTPGSRRRLGVAVQRVSEGMHWCDGLQQARLITRAQNAVIKSAERAGNLAWALNEMADGRIRRSALRAQAALNVLFPACLIAFGLSVFLVAVGMLMPLFSLIGGLA